MLLNSANLQGSGAEPTGGGHSEAPYRALADDEGRPSVNLLVLDLAVALVGVLDPRLRLEQLQDLRAGAQPADQVRPASSSIEATMISNGSRQSSTPKSSSPAEHDPMNDTPN